ncbi:hypothetical protein [Spirosoma sordidisoli]|uniref:Uncharacterized protein n=1 Tax=Spirosoma sordidisoli TaxID=2502893 RepID=A0A4Q2USE7_9BACT|nr:hypothetical protein [Spirosoma sordidisoli]RYC70675.1 hypothetical protein EQG79_00555 [Spirosoma sordidisoli]
MCNDQKYNAAIDSAKPIELPANPTPSIRLALLAGPQLQEMFEAFIQHKYRLYEEAANELAAHDLDAYFDTTQRISLINDTLYEVLFMLNEKVVEFSNGGADACGVSLAKEVQQKRREELAALLTTTQTAIGHE